MKETDVEKFKRLSNVDIPHPENCKTVKVVDSNGRISLLLKEDGTYCFRNENTGQENGCYLCEQIAREIFKDMANDDNDNNI